MRELRTWFSFLLAFGTILIVEPFTDLSWISCIGVGLVAVPVGWALFGLSRIER
jgi:hypothetical protein